MDRFITINNTLVNTAHITHVAMNGDDALRVFLDNGDVIDADTDVSVITRSLEGRDHVVAIAPCEDVMAIMEIEGKEVFQPVRYFAVTAAGDVRPLDVSFECVVFIDEMESFRGILNQQFDFSEEEEGGGISVAPVK